MEIFLSRNSRSPYLAPAFPDDHEKVIKIRPGEVYRAKVTMPRNIKFHRKFFALLNLTLENLPEDFRLVTATGQQVPVKTTKDLLWLIKMETGHYEKRVTLRGDITYEAKSISFARMDQSEFEDFYNSAVNVILQYILPYTEQEELEREVALRF